MTSPRSLSQNQDLNSGSVAPLVKLNVMGDTQEMRKGKNLRDTSEVTQRTWKWIEGKENKG